MKKIIIKKRKINNKLFLTRFLITGLSSSLALVPIGLSISYSINSKSYVFDGKHFSSKNSVLDYVKRNSLVQDNYVNDYNSQWKILINNQVKTFSDVSQLRQTIYDNYIKQELYKTNVDFSQYENENGVVSLNDDIWQNIYSVASQSAQVYQGANDVAYDNQEDAYQSLYNTNVKNAYYFNGTYFNTKSDLRTYLVEQYLPNNSSYNTENTIVLQGPNNVKSAPINLNDKDALSQITDFIINNAKKVLSYTNSKTSQQYTITKDNLNGMLNNVSASDLDYIHVQSNQGQSRYVIDNKDDANLIGPYFYNGVLDVGSFTNKKMWKKVNGVTDSVYVESKVDSMIGSFFTSIINDDASLSLNDYYQNNKTPPLFRTMLTDEYDNSYDQEFIYNLQKLSPKLAEEVTKANLTLLQGKKYNTFNKIPILYSFLMQRAISWGLGQDVVNLIIDYFTNVCNFIQDAIELVVMDNSLLKSKDNKTTFNVAKFFGIGNPEYDLNTSTEYFLNQIKTQYPSLVAAMNTYISAQNNIAMMSGLIPYSALDNSFLVEFKIFSSQKDLDQLNDKLKPIYTVFSSLDYEKEMLVEYIENSSRDDVKQIQSLDQKEWKDAFSKLKGTHSNMDLNSLLSGIGAKNNQYHALSKAMLDLEIKTYISTSTIAKDGYLSKIYSNNPNYDKLGPFIDLVKENPSLDSFKVYMAILIDKRMNTSIFNNQTLANPYEFAKALSRVIFFGLGSAVLVKESTTKIYQGVSSRTRLEVSSVVSGSYNGDNNALSSPLENPLFQLVNSSKDVYNPTTSKTIQTRGNNLGKIDLANNPSARTVNVNKHNDVLKKAKTNTRTSLFDLPWFSTIDLNDAIDTQSIVSSIIGDTSKMTPNEIKRAIDQNRASIRSSIESSIGDSMSYHTSFIDEVSLMTYPTDESNASLASKFDSIDGFSDSLLDGSIPDFASKSQTTQKLNQQMLELMNKRPEFADFANKDDYFRAYEKWDHEYSVLKTKLEVSEINDADGFAYPLRSEFLSSEKYEQALKEWRASFDTLLDDLQNHSPDKFNALTDLRDYPQRQDFGSDSEYYKAALQYKEQYNKIIKQTMPELNVEVGDLDFDMGHVGTDTPDVGNGIKNSNLHYPKLSDFSNYDDYVTALSNWQKNYDDFKLNGLDKLDDNLKSDFVNSIGDPPKRSNFDSDAQFEMKMSKWEKDYNTWMQKNLPNNIQDWSSQISSQKPSVGGGSTIDVESTKTSKLQKLKDWWSGNSTFKEIKETALKVLNYSLEIIGTAFAVMEIFFFIYDLIQVNYTQDFYEYTTADGTHFYWDGGLTVSRFMGLDVKQEKGIDSMELLNPIQITLPQTEEFYYFNQVKYYSLEELKKAELLYVFNGGSFVQNNNFKVQYSFGTNIESNYVQKADDLDKLLEAVLTSLNIVKKENGSYDLSQINKNSELIANTSTSYDNGVIVSKGDNNITVAENIVNNIRATKIVKLPDVDSNGFYKNTNSTFVFPGNYFDTATKKVIKQDANQFKNYLVDNSANNLKPGVDPTKLLSPNDYVISDINAANNNANSQLYNLFKNAFSLNTKSILPNQASKKFSAMLSDNFTKPLYMVSLPKSSPVYFADQTKAMNYVLSSLNFEKEIKDGWVKSYTYNGIYFANEQLLKEWVFSKL